MQLQVSYVTRGPLHDNAATSAAEPVADGTAFPQTRAGAPDTISGSASKALQRIALRFRRIRPQEGSAAGGALPWTGLTGGIRSSQMETASLCSDGPAGSRVGLFKGVYGPEQFSSPKFSAHTRFSFCPPPDWTARALRLQARTHRLRYILLAAATAAAAIIRPRPPNDSRPAGSKY